MRLRYTTKAVLGLTGTMALVFAWYASTLAVLQRERRAITQIQSICPINVWTEDGGGLTCGNWAGTRLETENTAPWFLRSLSRRLGISTFDRVRRITFDDVHDAQLVALASRFTKVRSIEYRYSPKYLSSEDKHRVSSMIGGLILYAEMNPHIAIEFPSRERLIEDSVFQPNNLDIDDPFASMAEPNHPHDLHQAWSEDPGTMGATTTVPSDERETSAESVLKSRSSARPPLSSAFADCS